jgi:cation diffusion facilitator CzcD-associated flavoprotein CzcO
MSETPDFDVVVIGAGFTGMYATYRLRQLGYSVKGLEEAADVGGTWWDNRYPGCRVDVESYLYCYGSCLDEVRRTFNWTERFASQPEVLRYLYAAADYMDIRKDYLFNTRVKRASWNEKEKFWHIDLHRGGSTPLTARYVLSAMGALSASQMPKIKGLHTFKGPSFHTAHWPHDPDPKSTQGAKIDFSGKRVAVIGTGSSGVQVIQELAKVAGALYVFQRSPTWCTPLGNGPLTTEELAEVRLNFPRMDEICDNAFVGDPRAPIDKSIFEVSDKDREETLERLYRGPGFSLWVGNFRDVLVDKRANDVVTAFVTKKIRQRVKAPRVADLLVPQDHGFGIRRVPLETNYYEVYNQDNVILVDARSTPIESINPRGIKTTDRQYDLDVIVYASGFDALRGALARVEVIGRNGASLSDAWRDGVRSYLGLQIPGFPNFFTLVGPQNATGFGNVPRNSVAGLNWVIELLEDMRKHGLIAIEATQEAAAAYADQIHALGKMSLFATADSWFTGVNKNIPDRQRREILFWVGGMPAYLQLCRENQANGWRGFKRS